MSETASIHPFDPQSVSDAEWGALNALENAIRAERWPEDPPRTVEETRREIESLPGFIEVHAWAAWDPWPETMAALGYVILMRTDENRHMGQMEIQVRPEYRRQGWARELLRRIAEAARERERSLLIASSDSRIPAGEAFLERLGARVGLASHVNQLEVADVDPDQLRQWQEQARERAADFEIGLWDGPYPEDELEAVAELNKVMNSAPRGDLDVEDFDWTPEQLRQTEASLQHQGVERWTMVARHRPTGQFAGYTETYWNPNRPETLQQGNTGVFPEYRGHGLGKWLKAAMLAKVVRDKPQVKRIRTGNADVNEAMLAINRQLGFQPYKSIKTWQAELEKVQAYLDSQH